MGQCNTSLNAKVNFYFTSFHFMYEMCLSFPKLHFFPKIVSERFELSDLKYLYASKKQCLEVHLNLKKVDSLEPKPI